MLVTLRVPIADARRFSSDDQIADSVVLPSWAEGDFVRGVGRITTRPGGVVEPWRFEASFADGRHFVTVPPEALANFAQGERKIVEAVRKRVWQALEDSTASLDVDLGFQIRPRSSGDGESQWSYAASGASVAASVGALAAMPVRVRGKDTEVRLITVGSQLAARYAHATSVGKASHQLVGAGRIVGVVEAPGVALDNRFASRSTTLSLGRVTLSSLDVLVPGGGQLRCHILHSASRSTGDRKRIRELRIHLLRLHSVFELMRFLAGPAVTGAASPLADGHARPDGLEREAYSRLQKTMLSCVRVVRPASARPGGVDPDLITEAAQFARRLVDLDMQNMLTRMLTAARPRVQRELEAVLENEHKLYAADAKRTAVYNVNVTGGVVGVIGDDGTATIGVASST